MTTNKAPSQAGTAPLKKSPTIRDVAKLANVSAMTVSRVINGDTKVNEYSRQRVLAAVTELRYLPNPAARKLAGAAPPMRMAFLYCAAPDSYLGEFIIGLLNQASVNNVQLVVEKCEADEESKLRACKLITNGIDGFILPPPLCDITGLIDHITNAGIPVMALASGKPDPRASAAGVDDFQAAYAMTRHLISLDHERIGFIIGHPEHSASAIRLAGFEAAMKDCRLPVAPELIKQGMFSYRSGLDAAEILLKMDPPPTAIFASNDDMAAAAVAVAHRFGLDVPGDLTVVGFDDSTLATKIWPQLTTVRMPVQEMAEAAVQVLARQICSLRNGMPEARQNVVVDFTLVRRQSDAAPRLRPTKIIR